MVTFMVRISGEGCPGQTKEERKMARHGENIRKRKDGRWEARYQIFDAGKGRNIYRSVYGSTYEKAKEKRADAMEAAKEKWDLAAKQRADGKETCMRIQFSQAAAGWLKEVLDQHKYSTYIKYESIYRVHLERIAGSCLLSDLSGQAFREKISDHLSEKGLSDSIRRSICCVANQILDFAGRKYSVCVPAWKPAFAKAVKKPVETFTKAEQSRLFACIDDRQDKFKIALLLCLYTGMRLGELCALRWTDLDLRYRTVTVNRTVQRISVKGYTTKTVLMETDPKSKCSKRTIPLTAEVMELLEGLKEERPYVFGSDRPLEPRTMQYRFKRILQKAEIDVRNFHILRHTFATNCVESGMDVKTPERDSRTCGCEDHAEPLCASDDGFPAAADRAAFGTLWSDSWSGCLKNSAFLYI